MVFPVPFGISNGPRELKVGNPNKPENYLTLLPHK